MKRRAMRCPPEGQRVVARVNPVSRALYSGGAPPNGTGGKVVSIPLGSRRATCMGGPGGGLVYVKWDNGMTMGISSHDMERERLSGLGSMRGKKRRRKRRH